MVAQRSLNSGTMRPPSHPVPKGIATGSSTHNEIDVSHLEQEDGDEREGPISISATSEKTPVPAKGKVRGSRGERDNKSIRQSYSCAECRR
jgi:hypothetical protein